MTERTKVDRPEKPSAAALNKPFGEALREVRKWIDDYHLQLNLRGDVARWALYLESELTARTAETEEQARGFPCCGGSDETPPEHTQDCSVITEETIDDFAEKTGEFPQCYRGDGHWFYVLRGEMLRGRTPGQARNALAAAIRAALAKARGGEDG